MSKKTTGAIGVKKVTAVLGGVSLDDLTPELPTNKEALERVFADEFVDHYNREKAPRRMEITGQGDTHDLDFRVSAPNASYLELAEATPLTDQFGKDAMAGGSLSVFEFAEWIFDRVIKAKSAKYGSLSSDVILLIYFTRPEFLPTDSVIECLRSFLWYRGCKFESVWLMRTSLGPPDVKLTIVNNVSHSTAAPPKPDTYKGLTYQDLKFTVGELPPGVVF